MNGSAEDSTIAGFKRELEDLRNLEKKRQSLPRIHRPRRHHYTLLERRAALLILKVCSNSNLTLREAARDLGLDEAGLEWAAVRLAAYHDRMAYRRRMRTFVHWQYGPGDRAFTGAMFDRAEAASTLAMVIKNRQRRRPGAELARLRRRAGLNEIMLVPMLPIDEDMDRRTAAKLRAFHEKQRTTKLVRRG